MEWYEIKGKEQDVVVSSRIRLARNIVDYPFEPKLDNPSANEIIDKVKSVFDDKSYDFIDFSVLSANEKNSYAEKHIVSTEFAKKTTPHALIRSKEKQVYIMVCEEDHLRVQSILPGFNLSEAYENVSKIDEKLNDDLKIAYSENFGYLTHCPTNLGTAMRASVMMYLPAISMNGEMKSLQYQLEKMGIIIRGMSGEGSKPYGYLYQISNQVTLGVTEQDIIDKLTDVVNKIIKRERELRNSIKDDDLTKTKDSIMRSLGIMKYAILLSSREFIDLYADIRLGIALGFVNIEYTLLDSLLVTTMPSNISCIDKKMATSGIARDQKRAEIVRKVMA